MTKAEHSRAEHDSLTSRWSEHGRERFMKALEYNQEHPTCFHICLGAYVVFCGGVCIWAF